MKDQITPPSSVFLLLDDAAGPLRRAQLARWLERTLPWLNWRTHLLLAGGREQDPEPAGLEELARSASRHVRRRGFVTLYLHPLVQLRSAAADQLARLERLLFPARTYQLRAYHQQGEAQLLVLPVVAPAAGMQAAQICQVAKFLRARFAEPSFYFRHPLPAGLTPGDDGMGFRAYLDPGEQAAGGGVARQLWINHLLETMLERVEQPGARLLEPCTRHLVLDEAAGQVFTCFSRREADEPLGSLERVAGQDAVSHAAADLPRERCGDCLARAMLAMEHNLRANGRQEEGRRVYFELSLALAGQQQYPRAAELAHQAHECSTQGSDRAAALIHEALCRKELGQLEQAEQLLVQADELSDDPGYVAYLRGRVQFDWRDYIEALERFEEALELGSGRVPLADMLYEMALSHINIEEYADARGYLRRHGGARDSQPVRFYLGVCDHGEGRVQSALAHFEEALRMDPSPEDRGRVLFYIGSCYKELELFTEAIDVLVQAARADPEDIANHNLLGYCYYKTKQHQLAVECFERAVQIDPRSGIDWANLGSNLRDLGRTEEALVMYRKGVALDRSLGFAWENIARIEGEIQDTKHGTRNREPGTDGNEERGMRNGERGMRNGNGERGRGE